MIVLWVVLGGIMALGAKVLIQVLPHAYIKARGQKGTVAKWDRQGLRRKNTGAYRSVCEDIFSRMKRRISHFATFPKIYALQCERCHAQISYGDYLPFLTVFRQCRICGDRYPLWFFGVDILAVLGVVIVASQITDLFLVSKVVIFFILSIVIFFTDLHHQYVPDRITLILGISAILLASFSGTLESCVLSMVWIFLTYFTLAILARYIFKKDAIGGGDIKYATVMAGFWGIQVTLMSLYLGYLLAALISIVLLGLGLKKRGDYIPFIPAMQIGLILAVFYGNILKTLLGI